MKALFTLLISLLLILPVAALSIQRVSDKAYIAVVCSPDLIDHWNYPTMKTDYLAEPTSWKQLGIVLDHIMSYSDGREVFLDFMVHGDETGLQTRTDDRHYDNANMGYVVRMVQEHCHNRRVLLAFESCYSGRAYKCTIRGVKPNPRESIYNYETVPPFPVLGTGDSHTVIGQPMYLQFLHDERYFWVDLRDYDQLGKNRPLHPKEINSRLLPYGSIVQATTKAIWDYVERYRY